MRSFVLAAAVAAASAAVEPGYLTGVFAKPDDTCSLWTISPSTGDNATVGPTNVCADGAQGIWPAFSTQAAGSNSLIIAIAEGAHIYSVDLKTAKTTNIARITYNDTDPFIGAYACETGTYIVTQYNVWIVNEGKGLDVVVSGNFPQDAQVVGAPSGGTGGSPILYIHDEDSDTMFTVDIGAQSFKSKKTGIKGLLDLQYDDQATGKARLIAVCGYTLYSYDLTSGKLSKVGSIPDGPGYPRVNALSPSGKTLAIIDFANVFTLDTITGEVGPLFPFTYAPKTVGHPVWVSA